MRRPAALAGCAALAVALLPGAAGAAGHGADRARAVLPAGDGWGSAGAGVTGGSAADADHVYTVSTRAELAAALEAGGDVPRIIRIEGTIDANTDDEGNPLTCQDYATDGYTPEGYLAAYDPATWGKVMPSGPLEEARLASAANQAERVVLPVGSNTTVIGVGNDARLLGGSLDVTGADNVIIRNITFEDAYDCFPQWDGRNEGEWNSEYDNVVIDGSVNVWVDHNTFTDGRRPDSEQPSYFGALYQQHDGLLDIVRGADLTTVTWNVFTDHAKSILIGNSDGAAGTDLGHLRTTFHHNLFQNVGERVPRVRFGQVDVYNNHYRQEPGASYHFGYRWGIGAASALVAEHNAITLPRDIDPASVIHRWTPGTSMTENGNIVNGRPVDLLAAYNAANPDAPLGDDAGWTPELRPSVDHPRAVPRLVDAHAGAGRLPGTR
ncbi:pectate lyase family protein [Streptomyces litchfieldiae]|uniref:Pectate lyase n=1 Tax=Streptomyces litchfieldiae TaxID=3075543 RepID=A0ABU2MZR1_9ACTN|nr:pectate lyase [Streptomyces sp. DSM 44938]MDT0347148.1 pectate lyase [Streptomyces sp. DSM 44938]